jgi:carboxypeptidase C (cathepsin A)
MRLPVLLCLAAALGAQPYDDTPSVTRHQAVIGGKPLRYVARTGFLSLRDETNEVKGRIFYVSYTVEQPAGGAPRPVTFAWNGGPGAASSLLHLGGLGPKRVKALDEYQTPPPPFALVDNEDTWLTTTDLVMVDPIGTGYSYATRPEYTKMFWSVQGDIDSIAEFIRLYLTRYELTNAPVFIAGESYGTLRAAGLADTMTERRIPLDGVILISSILDFRTSRFAPGNDLPYILILPSFTAAAFAHKKLPAELQPDLGEALRQAESWAETQYAAALFKGDRITAAERQAVASQYARLSGLDAAFVEQNNLRVGMEQFALRLLSDRKQVVGHYDTRKTGKAPAQPQQYDPRLDPSLSADGTGDLIAGYLRRELGFQTDARYAGPFGGGWPTPTTPRGDWMSVRWDWGSGEVERVSALKRAMVRAPSLRVFVAAGYYDLATPYFAADYVVGHAGLDAARRGNIAVHRYHGGHAVYMDKSVRQQFSRDILRFLGEGKVAP